MLDGGAVVKEIQGMRDDGHLSDALLRKAVRSVATADDRYDWVGIYLVGEGEELWLHNYVGEPTQHAKIPAGAGVCGRALAQRRNINVKDVSKDGNYLACSPDTKSELVILIRAGDQIYGEINLDSDQAAAFVENDEIALIGIADKLAEQLAAERR
ncbi:MAG: GAF domain-containing protein [Gemmatimonadetes bacterium]|nr:GAF domain-containing protein [Gemmatimonadota bacterium]MSR35077.1 GAF domain-containing protein [Gemmatimonadota bacterium]